VKKPLLAGVITAACVLFFTTAPLSADDDPLPPDPETQKAPARDWSAWKQVPKLRGESRAQVFSQHNHTDSTGHIKQGASRRWSRVDFSLELSPDPDPYASRISWRVTETRGSGGESSAYRAENWSRRSAGTTTGSYSGEMSLRTEPTLHLNLKNGDWGFMTLGEAARPFSLTHEGEVLERHVGSNRNEQIHDTTQTTRLEHGWVQGIAPKQIAPFGGTLEVDLFVPARSSASGGDEPGQRTVRVQFWPDWDDVEVLVEIENYAKWRPRGNIDDPARPGPLPLDVYATLRPKKQNPTPAELAALPEVRRFRFELSATSREPGVCMNWPVFGPDAAAVPKEDPDYDLRFTDAVGLPTQLSPKKQKAAVKPFADQLGRPAAWVQLDCYDFGAHADLRVIAELADGREITGHLQASDGPCYIIKLPERRDGSLIAQNWRDEMKTTDDDAADDDSQPTADGQKGDGFSTYEEYRGFRLDGAHKRLRPERKDLLLCNLLGTSAEPALDLLMSKTADAGGKGFAIHYHLRPDEKPDSRAINLNRSAKSPRTAKEPQHALLLLPRYSGGSSEADMGDVHNEVAWRPKSVAAVYVLTTLEARDFTSTIMHEVSHAIGARHHGNSDPARVFWDRVSQMVASPTGPVKRYHFVETSATYDSARRTYVSDPTETGTRIRIYFEKGGEIDPNSARAAELFAAPLLPYLAAQNGQHSGDDQCFMRYDLAAAYIPPRRPNDRILIAALYDDEPPGLDLCTAPAGTGVNAPGRQPLPRYGSATNGNCHTHLCVRDDAPDKLAGR
jgi:hypothetical protein